METFRSFPTIDDLHWEKLDIHGNAECSIGFIGSTEIYRLFLEISYQRGSSLTLHYVY